MEIKKVILLIESSRGFGRDLLSGIARYSSLHGPWTFYRQPPYFRQTMVHKQVMEHLRNWNADGIIARETTNLNEILDFNLPTIVATNIEQTEDDQYTKHPVIIVNNDAVGKIAARHLMERGLSNFAFYGYDELRWSRARGESFAQTVKEAGHDVFMYKQPKKKSQRTWDNEQPLTVKWLQTLPKPIGLMACTDDRASQAIEACKIANLHVPDDVAVIGVDNDKLTCNLSNPPLSSVALATERAGYEAAELMDKMMAGQNIIHQEIIIQPTHVVPRLSTDVLAVQDSDVAQAVRFIMDHSRELIQVVDVANAVSMSRRALEIRFRQALNRSVLDVIRQNRTDHVARLLVETNMSISEIANAAGYPSVKHISRSFRQEKGMTLLNYRKEFGRK